MYQKAIDRARTKRPSKRSKDVYHVGCWSGVKSELSRLVVVVVAGNLTVLCSAPSRAIVMLVKTTSSLSNCLINTAAPAPSYENAATIASASSKRIQVVVPFAVDRRATMIVWLHMPGSELEPLWTRTLSGQTCAILDLAIVLPRFARLLLMLTNRKGRTARQSGHEAELGGRPSYYSEVL